MAEEAAVTDQPTVAGVDLSKPPEQMSPEELAEASKQIMQLPMQEFNAEAAQPKPQPKYEDPATTDKVEDPKTEEPATGEAGKKEEKQGDDKTGDGKTGDQPATAGDLLSKIGPDLNDPEIAKKEVEKYQSIVGKQGNDIGDLRRQVAQLQQNTQNPTQPQQPVQGQQPTR